MYAEKKPAVIVNDTKQDLDMSKPRRISLSRVPSTTASVPILERHLMVDAKRDTFPRGIVNSIQESPVPGSAPASSGLHKRAPKPLQCSPTT